MVIERWTWQVRPSNQQEAIELLKDLVKALGFKPRVCSYRFGPVEAVSSDLEFDSFLDREKWWADLDTSLPEYVAWEERLGELTEPGITSELLIVH